MTIVLSCIIASARGADTLWPAQRGTAAGRAVCVWKRDEPYPDLHEWHFASKGSRRYRPGLAVWGSPALAVVGGRPVAFIGGYDHRLHALDLVAKERLWSKITNGPVGDAPAVGRLDGLPVVFWGASDRSVYAHFAAGGDRLWTRELVPPTNTQGPAQLSAPFLHDGTLYLTCFVYDRALARDEQTGLLFALDMRSGRERWRVEVSQGPVGAPVGRVLGGRLRLFVAAQKGLLQAIDVVDGTPSRAWTYQMPHEVRGTPVLEPDGADPLLFLGSKFGDLIALRAQTGEETWRRMAGNWIDNAAAVGTIDGENIVYVGSHDYRLYALRASDGGEIWARRLGGEVYSAPCLFQTDGRPAVAAATLDNHLYVLDATSGDIITSYFTGQAVWDKVPKGESTQASPVALQVGEEAALVHGSYSGYVYTLPLDGEVSLRATARSAASLWWGLVVVAALFLGVLIPVVLRQPTRKDDAPDA